MKRFLTGLLLAALIGMIVTIIDGSMGIHIWGAVSPIKAFVHIVLWAGLGYFAALWTIKVSPGKVRKDSTG